MVDPLSISSFCSLDSSFSSKEWARQVTQVLETLESLSQIKQESKYYFDERDGRFYKSSWLIAESLKHWIGDWAAGYLAKGEEIGYRIFWRLSINDSIKGIDYAKAQIINTLAIAARCIDSKSLDLTDDALSIEKEIRLIQSLFPAAIKGLQRLQWTYNPSTDKLVALEPAVRSFNKEIEGFASKILAQIEEIRRRTMIELVMNPLPNSTPLLIKSKLDALPPIPLYKENIPPIRSQFDIDSPPPPQIIADPPTPLPAPFLDPQTVDQRQFNAQSERNLASMQKYLLNHPEKIQELKASKEPLPRLKGRSAEIPWTVAATKAGIYFHYHISIVPKGKGGKFKDDKRGYSLFHHVDIAKLSTKIDTLYKESIAKNEEKFLTLCTEKNLPNIVKTFDVVWIIKEGMSKQIVYQEYCTHGNLQSNLERLKNEPTKIKGILIGILRGLAALHEENIVHRDIKPANVFLDKNDIPFIGDFGFACNQNDEVLIAGTPMYLDPEIIDNLGKNNASSYSDIWSFGMMMYGLLSNPTSQRPWPWLTEAQTLKALYQLNHQLKDSVFVEPPKEDLWIHCCWEALQLDPLKRPTAQQLLDRLSPTLQGLKQTLDFSDRSI